MMRYRGKFQRSAYPHVVIDPSDEGGVLEEKWKIWHEMESWKRYAQEPHVAEAHTDCVDSFSTHI
jgi:hypothetical protein